MLENQKFPIQFFRNFHRSEIYHAKQNHYDALELKQNCTDKEIRDAFVTLSKRHHPDSTSSANVEDCQKFRSVVDAYKVLGKSDTRAAYDHSLQFDYAYEKPMNTVEYDGQVFRPNKQKYGFPDPNAPGDPKAAYYGISGLKKISNKAIVLMCLIFAGAGITAQFFAIRHSLTFKRNELEQKSAKISKTHAEVRSEAEALGNQIQIERLRRKLNASE